MDGIYDACLLNIGGHLFSDGIIFATSYVISKKEKQTYNGSNDFLQYREVFLRRYRNPLNHRQYQGNHHEPSDIEDFDEDNNRIEVDTP